MWARYIGISAISFALTIMPAQAQSPDMASQIAALPLDQFCSIEGVLGNAWGAKNLPQTTNAYRGIATKEADATLAPFATYGLSTAKYSNQFYEGVFEAGFETKAAGKTAMTQLAQRYADAGWLRQIGTLAADDEKLEFGAPAKDSIYLYATPSDAKVEDPNGVKLELILTDNNLFASCLNAHFQKVHIGEAMGKYPDDLPKPVRAAAIPNAIKLATDCDDPAKRDAIISVFNSGGLANFAGAEELLVEAEYQERLAAWKRSKLIGSGKISEEDLFEKEVALLNNPTIMAAMEKSMASMDAVFSSTDKLQKLDKTGDNLNLCRGLIKMETDMVAAMKSAQIANAGQLIAVNSMFDDTAKKLGVVFPE
jgi:hypothetical protein